MHDDTRHPHPGRAGLRGARAAATRRTVQQLQRLVARLELEHLANATVLDRLQIGVILADLNGVVVQANQTARAIAAHRDRPSILVGPRDAMRIEQRLFRELVEPLFEPKQVANLRRGIVVSVPQRLGEHPLHVRAVPLPARRPSAPGELRPAVMIFMSDPGQHIETSEQSLRCLFHLTKTEARVARLLADGVALRDIAARLGMLPATARWHVKHLLVKTATTSQRQLACVLLASVASVRD